MKALEIPEITDPRGKHWEQPNRSEILIDELYAAMTLKAFNELNDYSMSTPTGVYPGKMWKTKHKDKWYLRWFCADDGDPRGLLTPTREIIII